MIILSAITNPHMSTSDITLSNYNYNWEYLSTLDIALNS